MFKNYYKLNEDIDFSSEILNEIERCSTDILYKDNDVRSKRFIKHIKQKDKVFYYFKVKYDFSYTCSLGIQDSYRMQWSPYAGESSSCLYICVTPEYELIRVSQKSFFDMTKKDCSANQVFTEIETIKDAEYPNEQMLSNFLVSLIDCSDVKAPGDAIKNLQINDADYEIEDAKYIIGKKYEVEYTWYSDTIYTTTILNFNGFPCIDKTVSDLSESDKELYEKTYETIRRKNYNQLIIFPAIRVMGIGLIVAVLGIILASINNIALGVLITIPGIITLLVGFFMLFKHDYGVIEKTEKDIIEEFNKLKK